MSRGPSPVLTVNEIVNKVNEELPISVTENDVENNPDFAHLLLDLTNKITKRGLTFDQEHKLTTAQEKYVFEKSRFLEVETLYSEIKDMLEEYNLLNCENKNQSQIYKELNSRLEVCEIYDYIDENLEIRNNILGLDPDFVLSQIPQATFREQQIDLIEKWIREKCDRLVSFVNEEISDSSKIIRRLQLPTVLENRKEKLNEFGKDIENEAKIQINMVDEMNKIARQNVSIIEELIVKYRLGIQSDHDKVISEWYRTKCDTLLLKLRLLKLRILCDTYNEDTVKALKVIKCKLDVKKDEIENETLSAKHLLQKYEAVGDELKDIVTEYCKVKENIDKRKWDLQRLDT